MSFEITIGTEKQIAYAKDLVAKRAHLSMGGNLYILDEGMKWIADYRAKIEAAAVPQEIKDKAFALLEKLPTCAAFWIGTFDDALVVIEAILTGDKRAIVFRYANLHKALTA